jgi:hypothetical protein
MHLFALGKRSSFDYINVPIETLWGTMRFKAAMIDTLAFLTEDNEKE